MSSFSIPLSGMLASEQALNVVSDNIANSNTQGFKSSSVLFEDAMNEASASLQVGAGVGSTLTTRNFTQGTVQTTGGALDAAIQGGGFFVMQNPSGATTYSRDGSFSLSPSGQLDEQRRLSGAGLDRRKRSGEPLRSGLLHLRSLALLASSHAHCQHDRKRQSQRLGGSRRFLLRTRSGGGLPRQHPYLDRRFHEYRPSDVEVRRDHSRARRNRRHRRNPLLSHHRHSHVQHRGVLTSPAAGAPISVKTTGGLADGAADLNINWNLFDTTNNPLVTQYASASTTTGSTQDGVQAATVTGVTLQNGGVLVATFSNGTNRTLAQLAVASISNPDSLVSVNNNQYVTGVGTSTPSVGASGTSTRGNIVAGSLEASNVDMATELTNLIVYQRGYQADAKAITSIDQMQQTLIAMQL